MELLLFLFFDSFLIWDFFQTTISSSDNTIIIKPVLKASEWPYYVLQIIFIAFGINLPLAIYGIYKFHQEGNEKIIYPSTVFLVCTIIVLFFIFTNGYGLTPRFIFLFFLILIPFSAYGLFLFGTLIQDKINRQTVIFIFLSIYIVGNNIIWVSSTNLRNYVGLSTEDLWGT